MKSDFHIHINHLSLGSNQLAESIHVNSILKWRVSNFSKKSKDWLFHWYLSLNTRISFSPDLEISLWGAKVPQWLHAFPALAQVMSTTFSLWL